MNTVSSQAEKIKEISGVNPLKCMKCGKQESSVQKCSDHCYDRHGDDEMFSGE